MVYCVSTALRPPPWVFRFVCVFPLTGLLSLFGLLGISVACCVDDSTFLEIHTEVLVPLWLFLCVSFVDVLQLSNGEQMMWLSSFVFALSVLPLRLSQPPVCSDLQLLSLDGWFPNTHKLLLLFISCISLKYFLCASTSVPLSS